MFKTSEDIVAEKIAVKHQGDKLQLEAIFSREDKILVEAPAGYGKTSVMVSKVAYMLCSKQISNPKKILALTFSVNAAYKIKKELSIDLPNILKDTNINLSIINSIYVSNYHGLCRSILKKYGRKLHSSLASIDSLQVIDDFSIKQIQEGVEGLQYKDACFLSDYNVAVREDNVVFLKNNFIKYCNVIITELLSKGFITHNAVITLVLRLFNLHSEIMVFYQKYFAAIFIDEFQDTNRLSYWLVRYLTTPDTKLVMLGDSLQRIYGFIGAIPNVMDIAQKDFGLAKIVLNVNFRFASNKKMLYLDKVIRRNAEIPSAPVIDNEAEVELAIAENQKDEAYYILRTISALISDDPAAKIAVLFKQRGGNTSYIIDVFKKNNIDYFYGLFSDEDKFYVRFNKECVFQFIELSKGVTRITRRISEKHIEIISEVFNKSNDPSKEALINLLTVFWKRLFTEYSFLSNDDKVNLIKDTFGHNGLKQYIEFLETKIVFSTIHAAKGLEWDYVLLPDMEQDSLPNYYGLCAKCRHKVGCNLIVDASNEVKFLEELSVFYVAVTRARKQVIFSASKNAAPDKFNQERSKNVSCFLSLSGIKVIYSSVI